jgi:hypothetical protein
MPGPSLPPTVLLIRASVPPLRIAPWPPVLPLTVLPTTVIWASLLMASAWEPLTPPEVFPLTTQFVIVSVPELWTPPPTSPLALFPLTTTLLMTSVLAKLPMPPPTLSGIWAGLPFDRVRPERLTVAPSRTVKMR